MSDKRNAVDPAPYAGFYGNDNEVFYFTPTGRVWLVASADDLPEVREVFEVPSDFVSLDQLITPEEAIEYCRQIQEASGEILLSE